MTAEPQSSTPASLAPVHASLAFVHASSAFGYGSDAEVGQDGLGRAAAAHQGALL
jgi:hypothetical protein